MIKIKKCLQGGNTRTDQVTIEIEADEIIKKRDILQLVFMDDYRYFKINELEVDKDTYRAKATQCGYYNMLHEQNYDLRRLINLEPILVIDKDTLARLDRESGYC